MEIYGPKESETGRKLHFYMLLFKREKWTSLSSIFRLKCSKTTVSQIESQCKVKLITPDSNYQLIGILMDVGFRAYVRTTIHLYAKNHAELTIFLKKSTL